MRSIYEEMTLQQHGLGDESNALNNTAALPTMQQEKQMLGMAAAAEEEEE